MGEYGPWFHTNIGIPQGDALSPILFAFYLELAMRQFKATHPQYVNSFDHFITHYADDTDIIDLDDSPTALDPEADLITPAQREVYTAMKETLAPFYLKLNDDKTEYTLLNKHTSPTLSVKKLGTILSPNLDVRRRTGEAEKGFTTLWKLWLHDKHIPLPTKVRLFNACIVPILTYNLHTGPYTQSDLQSIDTCHRKMLRRVCGIVYPHVIDNVTLYTASNTRPITLDIIRNRWNLFGKVLRLPANAPAKRYTAVYFASTAPKYRGPPTTIASVLNSDLKQRLAVTPSPEYPCPSALRTIMQLQALIPIAGNSESWARLVSSITDAKELALWTRLNAKTAPTQPNEEDFGYDPSFSPDPFHPQRDRTHTLWWGVLTGVTIVSLCSYPRQDFGSVIDYVIQLHVLFHITIIILLSALLCI
jgi:hypothetical protein